MDRPATPFWQSLIVSTGAILVGTLICAVITTFIIDNSCYTEATAWHQVDPRAQFVDQSYTFIRPRGIGITVATYEVDAPALWVALRYYMESGVPVGRYTTAGMAEVGVTVNPLGTRALVKHYTSCGI